LNDIIQIIKEWPVIVQGALGSALFWLVLLIVQRASSLGILYFSNHSRTQRFSWLISRECKHEAFGGAETDAKAAYATSCLIYRSLRHCYKGLMWLALGLIVYPFFDIGLVIGGFGMVYFFSKAFEVVAPFKENENSPEEWKKVKKELEVHYSKN
jgi:hypothetical protein